MLIMYTIFHNTITNAINMHLPIEKLKINKHKHKKSHWITSGIIKYIHFRDKLFMKLKKAPVDSIEYRHIKILEGTLNLQKEIIIILGMKNIKPISKLSEFLNRKPAK